MSFNAHQYAQNTCQTHCHACTSSTCTGCHSVFGQGAAVEAYMLAPQLCHASHTKAGTKFVIVVKCKHSQCLWSFYRRLLRIAVRDILALYCGIASCYDVKVRVDRVKADMQVYFWPLGMRCRALSWRPGLVAALCIDLHQCSGLVISLASISYRCVSCVCTRRPFLVWCMLAKTSLRLPSWLPRRLHQESSRTVTSK